MRSDVRLELIKRRTEDLRLMLYISYDASINDDIKWLIDRLDLLIETLEYIAQNAGHSNLCNESNWSYCDAGCEYSFKASKALEGK